LLFFRVEAGRAKYSCIINLQKYYSNTVLLLEAGIETRVMGCSIHTQSLSVVS
jgi:hypothetical protein